MHDVVFILLMNDCCHSKNYCNKRETDGTTFSCVISIFEKGAPTCSAENARFLCFKLH